MKKKQSLAVTNKRGKYVHQSVDATHTTNFGTTGLTGNSVDSRNQIANENFSVTLESND